MARHFALFAASLLLIAPAARADDDVKDVPSQDLRVGKDDAKRFFLIGPLKDVKPPADGFGLVVVLPGGDGSADFHTFVKRMYLEGFPTGYLAAQPVALKANVDQGFTWPTAADKEHVKGLKFTAEELVDQVIDEVAAKHKLNPRRVFTLSWSSGGPAAYASSLTSKKVTGSFVAMSVFKPKQLPKLDAAKGHRYFIYHSEDDRVCPFRMAKEAEKELTAAGAKVEFKTYDGGHGWTGHVYHDVWAGLKWLEENAPKK